MQDEYCPLSDCTTIARSLPAKADTRQSTLQVSCNVGIFTTHPNVRLESGLLLLTAKLEAGNSRFVSGIKGPSRGKNTLLSIKQISNKIPAIPNISKTSKTSTTISQTRLIYQATEPRAAKTSDFTPPCDARKWRGMEWDETSNM